jgi:tRNA(Ile2)-agmatinylcytidine synthase
VKLGAKFVDYPNLLRLNPNVPWKTRGNASVSLRMEVDPGLVEPIKEAVIHEVEADARFECSNTNPGVAFHEGKVSKPLTDFSERVIEGIVTLDDALKTANEKATSVVGFKNKRGIIGALAAIGGLQGGDHTFELIAYRTPENIGTPRVLDEASVIAMDEKTEHNTFNNVDRDTGRVLIAPRGMDPVFFGVRGESPSSVYGAGMMVKPKEAIERWVIFRSNQGTDAHLNRVNNISELRLYHPAAIIGEVLEKPKTIQGGHVIFGVGDETGRVDCAAYEPTGRFRGIVGKLVPGDGVKAYGGVKNPLGRRWKTLNLEKIEILKLIPRKEFVNPPCPQCKAKTESMGRGKGYRCKKCKHKDRNLTKLVFEVERGLGLGLYIPPARANRHLTKPLSRYGREKKLWERSELFKPWRKPWS